MGNEGHNMYSSFEKISTLHTRVPLCIDLDNFDEKTDDQD